MSHLTSHERITRMYEHRDADRVPIIDYPWNSTVKRWQQEGMPANTNYVEYFDLDRIAPISTDNSPRFPYQVIEETDQYIIYISRFGVTEKQWKNATSTPEFLAHTIVDPDSWNKAKERVTPSRDRVNWKYLKDGYKGWRENGYWISANLWFGFDVTHSWIVGTERVLTALIEQPEWMMDMFGHMLSVDLALLDMIWDEGYHFDEIFWCDDMGYKYNQFFSLRMYRQLVKPFHQKAIDWAHAKGIKARLHSCGNINPFVPELISMGLDGLNPLEVKAGMDPIYLKQTYGKDLLFHGGINAVLWDQPEKISAEMEKVIPVMKESGGYIFSSDHSVPDTVSLKDFTQIIERAKKLGSYE